MQAFLGKGGQLVIPQWSSAPSPVFAVSTRLGRARLRRYGITAAAICALVYLLFLVHRGSVMDIGLGASSNSISDTPTTSWWPAQFTSPNEEATNPQTCFSHPRVDSISSAEAGTTLPHIPSKIWQIYLAFHQGAVSSTTLFTWISVSPSHTYTILDASGAMAVVGRLGDLAAAKKKQFKVPLYQPRGSKGWRSPAKKVKLYDFARDVVPVYEAMSRRVIRSDFLRYLILALEGGVYSDMDTSLVRPVRDWVPEAYRSRTRLIVGIEADSSPPIAGTKYEVQFCQWTLASEAHHPTPWTMVNRILSNVRERLEQHVNEDPETGDLIFTNDDVLGVTGPAAWTEVVFEHLNRVAGDGVGQEPITWETLTGTTQPRLYGDTLVLPIKAFATGVEHSGSSMSTSNQTLVRHQFRGHWKAGGD